MLFKRFLNGLIGRICESLSKECITMTIFKSPGDGQSQIDRSDFVSSSYFDQFTGLMWFA